MSVDISSEELTALSSEDGIAIIGTACKFPGADNPDAFWQNILSQNESISFFNEEELINAGIDPGLVKNSDYVAARGILTDVDKFDAAFFGYSSSEASITDPQHRVFLEQSWAALESAGYTVEQFSGPIGVFAGMSDSAYLQNNLLQNNDFVAEYEKTQTLLATSTHYLATKIAYSLGLTGPCVNVNTACSTSLVAIALACESLNNYDCDMALAGGITINVPQQAGYEYQESGIFSSDGHCRAFDKNANGTVFSNGCGIVVLKRLSDAVEAHDNIIAVIKGWAINNDGSDKVGFTAPSINGQALCASQAMAFADIKPTEVDYLEAHGTGTLLGDPIEITALTKGYQYNTYKKAQYCAIGSVKTNIGHTDVAAGVAGFIKTALALKEKILPPTLHYITANEKINFIDTPFYVNDIAQPWLAKGHPRTAAVNSLGFGGTNAHVILQEAPPVTSTVSKSANIIVLSAKTPNALATATVNLYIYLQKHYQESDVKKLLADTAYTLQLGRKQFKYRRAIAYKEPMEILQALNANTSELKEARNGRIIFAFPGQGTQYANMAHDIYKEQPFFKQIVDDCCESITGSLGLNLREIIFPSPDNVEFANEKLCHTQYAQPALFIIEYALARLLMELGINPSAMIGHSIGEYIAATISGVMNLHDALTLIVGRANLMAKVQPGTMLVVPLSKEKLVPMLTADVSLAAHNAPELCVVSGTKQAISDFEKRLKLLLVSDNLSCVNLHTSHAFHSSMMEEILDEFSQLTASLSYGLPQVPYISNITGDWIAAADLTDTRYWANHIRQTVHFSEGVNSLHLTSNDIVIEVGPGKTLTHLIRQHQKNTKPSFLTHTLPPHQEYQADSYFYFMEAISNLWSCGRTINWKNLYSNEIRKRRQLPTYPFEGQSYWIYPSKADDKKITKKTGDGLLYTPTWERDLKLSSLTARVVPISIHCWLVFINNDRWCDLLVQHLRLENHQVYTVKAGDDFAVLDDYSYVIAPDNKDHYLKLLQLLNIDDEYLTSIHAWSLNSRTDGHDKIFESSALSLLYLSQAFTEVFSAKNLNVLALANRVYTVVGNEAICPEKSTIIGPCKVIPLEQENTAFKFIDLELEDASTSLELANCVYWEANTILHESNQTEIAYRGSYRWLRQLKLCDEHIKTNQAARIKPNGVYLITGGLGGIGLALAQHLAKNYQANLVLISKSDFLPENEWQGLLKNSSSIDTKLFKQITALNIIKANAASLLIKQASVENEEQLSAVLHLARKRFGCIDGVIHAAGVPGGGAAQLKTVAEYKRILSPKVNGTRNLIKLLKDEKLDFMVLVSSLTSITGFPGQIDYCSANLVLDAYATSHPFTHPVFCVAMNWQSWRDVGMAAESKTKLMDLDKNNSTSPEDAVLLFEKIMNSDLNQVVVSGADPSTLNVTHKAVAEIPLEMNLQREGSISANQHDNITEVLVELWRNVLGVNEISLDDDFAALGGHSLLAISLLEKIRKKLGFKISLPTLYKAKTIRALLDVIRTDIHESETSPLILLQQGGSKSPLFMLHPIGGTVFCYSELAHHLNHDRLIYGLQDPSIDQEKPLFNTLEEMATAYREIIQKEQPVGPYYLCGSSFGATLVVEIAHQLLLQNEHINFIGLLDGWAAFSPLQRDENYAQAIILRHQQDENSHVLPRNIDNQKFWEEMLKHRVSMMVKYQPQKISAKITLLKPKETLLEYQDVDIEDNHWSDYSTFPIDVLRVPGNHDTMLQTPHVKFVAKHIQHYLDLIDCELVTCKQEIVS